MVVALLDWRLASVNLQLYDFRSSYVQTKMSIVKLMITDDTSLQYGDHFHYLS
jgi:hypothetical protein